MPQVLKVAKTTVPSKLAGAIAHGLREEGELVVSAIGAEAHRITERAIELATRFLGEENVALHQTREEEQVSREDAQGQPITATMARYSLRAEKQEEATEQQ